MNTAHTTGTSANHATISTQDLEAMLDDDKELALFDVREAGKFGESHLLDATPLPYSRLELDIGALVPRRSVRIVLCDDGASGVADLAARRLTALGYSDVSVLQGGTKAWAAEGHPLFAGVNVPSKAFGEWVEHSCHTPRVTARELADRVAAGENLVILDGRPYAEYHKFSIPGGICCPNGELAYRFTTLVPNPKTKVVVNCAGRTRSIIGAETLIRLGVPNPVCALENGTQGWFLADLAVERGATRRYPERIEPERLPALRAAARRLAERFAIPTVAADDVRQWLGDSTRTTYLCDVRTAEEFSAGSLPGAVHAPGGQLIQATDQWIGVRRSRIVLIDGEGVRAPVVATWLKQMGWDVYVLAEGVRAQLKGTERFRSPLPELAVISAAELKPALDGGRCLVFDLNPGMAFRRAHIPGSRWSIRPRLAADALGATQGIVLVADDPGIARLAAVDLREAGHRDVRMLEGGLAAWSRAGHAAASSPDAPADAECIDYLFFVHDRHMGNKEAAQQYLSWEIGLLNQLEPRDRKRVR